MQTQRCQHCNRQAFIVLRGPGALNGLGSPARRGDHSFCPSCDWGRRVDELAAQADEAMVLY